MNAHATRSGLLALTLVAVLGCDSTSPPPAPATPSPSTNPPANVPNAKGNTAAGTPSTTITP